MVHHLKRVTALFSIETHRKLKLHALHSNRTLIEIINEAVGDWLDKHDPNSAR
jgi:hypothetical protein